MAKKDPARGGRELALAKLESSALNLDDAAANGMRIVKANTVYPEWPDVWCLHLVYHDLDQQARTDTCRVRLLEVPTLPFGVTPEKPMRYLQPSKTPPAAYFPPTIDWRSFAEDPQYPLLITEGELKAAAACKHLTHACIGLGGVDSWRSAKRGWSLLPELAAFQWYDRDVVICFDSDAHSNPDVARATYKLSVELRDRGARCRVAQLPAVEGLEKTGLDDFLVHKSAAELEIVLGAAKGDELTEALWRFNARYAMVLDPPMVHDDETNAKSKPGEFQSAIAANVWAEEQVPAKGEGEPTVKKVQVAAKWIEWPQRRQVNGVKYEPGKERYLENGTILNEWAGWGCEPKKGDITPWNKLLDHLFGAEDAARRWFENWCFWPLKNPGAKLLTAPLIWSLDQGLGKSRVAVTLGRIYGKNYAEISQADQDKDFNGWAAARQLVLVDDVSGHDSLKKADLMKKLITQEQLLVDIKHLPTYFVRDCVNYMLTSNRPNAVFVEEGDRRWMIHEVKDTTMEAGSAKTEAFFEKYQKWLDGDGPAALFHHALEVHDFGDWKPYRAALMTKAKADMVDMVRGELDQWFADLSRDPDAKLASLPAPIMRDLVSPRELSMLFNAVKVGRDPAPSTVAMRATMYLTAAAGGAMIRVVDGVEEERFYAVRNGDKWKKASAEACAEHVREGREQEVSSRGRNGRY